MNNTDKQLPSPEELLRTILKDRMILRNAWWGDIELMGKSVNIMLQKNEDDKNDFIVAMKEYAKQLIPFILQEVAEETRIKGLWGEENVDSRGISLRDADGDWVSVEIDSDSILSLEDSLIKKLGL